MVLRTACSYLSTDDVFSYNALKYNKKTGNITFQWSPDFNTADEPEVKLCILVKPDGTMVTTTPKKIQIWHHKWMWVGDDYAGFDVEESKARSKLWEPHVSKEEKSKIGFKDFWDSIKGRWE